MPRIQYISKTLSPGKLGIVGQVNLILDEYAAQGFTLTLRQLYYQFVARDLIRNEQREYKRLGAVVNDGRLCGLIDWNAIVDRTRNLKTHGAWDNPSEIVGSAASSFHINRWETQEHYVEVWIEKDALLGVIETVCTEMDVPYFSCRGYTSQSELWRAGMRMAGKAHEGKELHVLHLGDQ